MRFNPPPNWPTPPAGWSPPSGWEPDPAWGPPPAGWRLWLPEPAARSRRLGWIAVTAGVAVGAVFTVGAVAVASVVGDDDPDVPTPPPSASASPAPTPSASPGRVTITPVPPTESTPDVASLPDSTLEVPAKPFAGPYAKPSKDTGILAADEPAVITQGRGSAEAARITITSTRLAEVPDTSFGMNPVRRHFLYVTFRIEVTGQQKFDINPLSFTFRGSKGDQARYGEGYGLYAVDADDALGGEDLSPGDDVTGQIAFDVNSTRGQLLYGPNADSVAIVAWRLR